MRDIIVLDIYIILYMLIDHTGQKFQGIPAHRMGGIEEKYQWSHQQSKYLKYRLHRS